MMTQRALILANGPIADEDLPALRARLAEWSDARRIAADGGARHAGVLGLRLDAIVGDLDSADPSTIERLQAQGAHVIRFPDHKDETDLELALLHVARSGAEQVAILGATDGRLDMTLANLLLLLHPQLAHLHIEVWKGDQTGWLLRPPGGTIQGRPGDTVSLLPLSGDVTGITTQGLAYPLTNGTLLLGPARGVSNRLTESTARIRFEARILLAVHAPALRQEAMHATR